jgi:hypothetical protein
MTSGGKGVFAAQPDSTAHTEAVNVMRWVIFIVLTPFWKQLLTQFELAMDLIRGSGHDRNIFPACYETDTDVLTTR